MTLVAAPISFMPPFGIYCPASAAGTQVLDASTDLLAAVCHIPYTGTLDKVHYRVNAVSSPVGTLRISLQTVSATTGLPDGSGSLYGSSSAATVDASTLAANTNYTATVNATATRGDLVAVVFDYSAYTSGSVTLRRAAGRDAMGQARSSNKTAMFPYHVENTSGSTVKNTSGFQFPSVGFEYGGVFPQMFSMGLVGDGVGTTVTNSGVTRAGNIFRPTTPRRAIGIWSMNTGAGDLLFRLRLQSDDSILATATVDKDVKSTTTEDLQFYYFDSGTTVNIAAGTDYYILMEGNDATGGALGGITNFISTTALGWLPGGSNCYGVTYNASYTSYTTANAVRRYGIGLITDQEDDGTGGGGGLLTHPGMVGGIRG